MCGFCHNRTSFKEDNLKRLLILATVFLYLFVFL